MDPNSEFGDAAHRNEKPAHNASNSKRNDLESLSRREQDQPYANKETDSVISQELGDTINYRSCSWQKV